MEIITSRDNKSVKLIRKLKDKKYRDELGMYLIEGPNLLLEAIKTNEEIVLVGIDPDTKDIDEVKTITEILQDRVAVFSPDIFSSLADTVTPQNILAVIKKSNKPLDISGKRYVILDELQDPGNVGTIIRTAEAAGFTGIVAVKGTADIYSSKVVRAAAGSLFRINIIEAGNKEDVISFARNKDLKLYACDSHSRTPYTDADLRENVGLIIGNEGNGVCSFFMTECESIMIPMKQETESLNASVSAGIIIYESVRQLERNKK